MANLGTIHMLAGDLKTGKEFIDRAIVINPNAHFGREKYQSLLAEYFLTSRKSPHPAALDAMGVIRPKGSYCGFAEFVLEKRRRDQMSLSDDAVKEELAAAQKGVLGMMHFANYDSPLLLEALGDLLIAWPSYETDGLQLAARAYYRIAQLSDDDAIRKQFQSAAKNMVQGSLDYIKFRGDDKETHRFATSWKSFLLTLRTNWKRLGRSLRSSPTMKSVGSRRGRTWTRLLRQSISILWKARLMRPTSNCHASDVTCEGTHTKSTQTLGLARIYSIH